MTICGHLCIVVLYTYMYLLNKTQNNTHEKKIQLKCIYNHTLCISCSLDGPASCKCIPVKYVSGS